MTERITSRANPLMAHIRKLGVSRSYRRETGACLGDGEKLLREALQWGALLECVVYTPGVSLPELPPDIRVAEIPESLMKSVSPMETPPGILFTAKLSGRTPPERITGGRYLALEGVQDPGNVGTILRTADAFGADGVFLLPGCADICNPKTVRASMGAVFRLPVWNCTLPELQKHAETAGMLLYGAALRGDSRDARQTALNRCILLIGSEGRGLSKNALSACAGTVKIPMRERCESLNAAIAAAVLLWEGFR